MDTPQSILIFGAGYVGKHLARTLSEQGIQTFITTRSPDNFAAIEAETGATPLEFDHCLPNVTHMVSTAPPEDGHDPILARYAAHMPPNLQWVGYLSSTGVYGDYEGKSVTEESPLKAKQPRALARAHAESEWLESDLPVHIFRLSGIYGPGRNMLGRVNEGKISSFERSERPVNRIHVEDIVQALQASMAKPKPGRIYNLADDLPAPTIEVITYAAGLLNTSLSEEESSQNSHLMDGSRIVDNTRIKKELGVELKYPSYKDGLQALLRSRAA